jgi:hypothetical protein
MTSEKRVGFPRQELLGASAPAARQKIDQCDEGDDDYGRNGNDGDRRESQEHKAVLSRRLVGKTYAASGIARALASAKLRRARAS